MHNRSHWTRIILLIALMTGIGARARPNAARAQHPLSVIASTSILADVAQQVVGDAAHVEPLFPLGANAHSAEASAQDIARLSDADLVIVAGANYEERLLPVLEQAAGDRVVTASLCVPMRAIQAELGEQGAAPVPTAAPSAESSALDQQCAGHYDAVKAAFGLDEIAAPGALGPLYQLDCREGCDPHVWTDPVNVALWTLLIRDTLAERDPDHAADYQANAEKYLADLAAADQQVRGLVESLPESQRTLVTNHLTLGYFAARYGFTLVGVILPGGATSEPSTQDVLALIQLIEQDSIPAIFTENVVSDSLAQQVADETGAMIARLYTESLSGPGEGAETYVQYLIYNAQTIVDALKVE